MRALVDAFIEVRGHQEALLAFLGSLTPGNRRLGREFVFHSVRENALIAESRDTSTDLVRQRHFRLAPPASEFTGWAEEDSVGAVQVHIQGEGRYAGFNLSWPGLEGRLVVAAAGGFRNRATIRALWLKTRFVWDGALDSSRVISGRY